MLVSFREEITKRSCDSFENFVFAEITGHISVIRYDPEFVWTKVILAVEENTDEEQKVLGENFVCKVLGRFMKTWESIIARRKELCSAISGQWHNMIKIL